MRHWAIETLCALLMFAIPAASVAERLRDLAPTTTARVELQWSDITQLRGTDDPEMHMMRGQVRHVPYRLDLTKYKGKHARIELVIPMSTGLFAPHALTVYWRGDGQIPDGQLHAGGRRSVFVGRITEPVLDTTLDFDLLVDSRLFNGRLEFEPYFEITVDSQ